MGAMAQRSLSMAPPFFVETVEDIAPTTCSLAPGLRRSGCRPSLADFASASYKACAGRTSTWGNRQFQLAQSYLRPRIGAAEKPGRPRGSSTCPISPWPRSRPTAFSRSRTRPPRGAKGSPGSTSGVWCSPRRMEHQPTAGPSGRNFGGGWRRQVSRRSGCMTSAFPTRYPRRPARGRRGPGAAARLTHRFPSP